MERVTELYRKYRNFIENICFPVLLLVYPLLKVNQGLDVADTTYSLANFQYFGQMQGTWMVATFLANAVGSLLVQLPFGGTMMGMNFYTSLVQSATALMVYLGLKKRIPALLLFVGEMMALGLCWCPSTVLYNYLTYLLMSAGMLLIYKGFMVSQNKADWDFEGSALCVSGSKDQCYKKQRYYFLAAGACLGLNVAVRMPNVVQATFILAVWYGIIVINKESTRKTSNTTAADGQTTIPWEQFARTTVWCLAGYVLGFGIPLAVICIRYGFSAYPDMVATIFAMTEQATDYKPTSMLTGMFGDYIKGLYWLVFAGICAAAVGLALFARRRLCGAADNAGLRSPRREGHSVRTGQQADDSFKGWNAYKITGAIIKITYVSLLLLLLRFYWGRGMFTFHYYEYDYRSIYYPTVLFLLVTVYVCVYCLLAKRIGREQKIFAALLLVQIFVTPLGSNNKLFPIINNLFLALPFTLWVVYGLWDHKETDNVGADTVQENRPVEQKNRADVHGDRKVLWAIPFTLLTIFLLVQSVGFHAIFVFQDGIWGEARDTRVELPEKAAGVYTNRENAALMKELAFFVEEEGLAGRETITYGKLPGLHYFLDVPPALSTIWPDLESYRMTEYKRDLAALENRIAAGNEPPIIILSAPAAAYLSDDGEAIVWFGVDMEVMAADGKLRLLAELMREYGYAEVFGNARYVVYRSQVMF